MQVKADPLASLQLSFKRTNECLTFVRRVEMRSSMVMCLYVCDTRATSSVEKKTQLARESFELIMKGVTATPMMQSMRMCLHCSKRFRQINVRDRPCASVMMRKFLSLSLFDPNRSI